MLNGAPLFFLEIFKHVHINYLIESVYIMHKIDCKKLLIGAFTYSCW